MTTHTKNHNQTQQWNITASNDTWIVGQDATFTVKNANGIAENSYSGSTIKIFGDIVIKGDSYAGVHFDGSDSSVLIGAKSEIDASKATFGIFSEAAGSEITNRGHILAGMTGIYGAVWSDVTNEGTIKAHFGIDFDGDGGIIHNSGKITSSGQAIALGAFDALVVNEKDGDIFGHDNGVYFDGAGQAVFANKGTLRSDENAVLSQESQLTLKNTGEIIGNVRLGAGDDVFDNRHGTFRGKVFGGDDNDTYKIDSSGVKIVEGMTGGTDDRVFSTASYTLKGGIEELHLQGGKDLNGTGSGADNSLYGNKGDNTLSGKGGADWLDGGKGDDILIGGGVNDTFAFEKGYGKDIVRDFENGVDHFHSSEVASQIDFNNLDIKQAGENTVINFGNGDRLVIEDTSKSNIDYFDFV